MKKVIGVVIVTIGTLFLIVLLIGLLCAWPVQLLWNWLMPELFQVAEIGFWQAYGLFVLCGLLFKSYSTNSNK